MAQIDLEIHSRILSVVKTCEKRGLSALDVISDVVSSVIRKQSYSDMFNLIKTESSHLW
ncbi:hypothetical protein [Candidatus Enterovibrio escicola]|uniref:hypothetical protein n=1 Tax=Candidatus Enterovibrio escicola TaxID=1927127 RepID=UPI0016814CA3